MGAATATNRRRSLVVGLNLGIALVFLSVPMPWARVAGRSRSGPDFADLLLRLPEIPGLGPHLEIVALLWYAVPVLALVTWLTQFRSWPPTLDGWTVIGAGLLCIVVALLMAWLALRGVGFPQAGGVVASIGALTALAAAIVARGRRPGATAGE